MSPAELTALPPVDTEKYDRAAALISVWYRWLRFKAIGLENVPSAGAALLISNHAGLRLHDAFATGIALRKKHPAQRIVRQLAHKGITEIPLAAKLQIEYGAAVVGTPQACVQLIEEGWLVLTYPEGAKSTARRFSDRDTVLPVEEWGTGWAQLALDTGVPVIPVGVSGVESAIPTVGVSNRLGKRWGLLNDEYPVSPQSPLIGFHPFLTPLLPFPVRCGVAFGEPITPENRPTNVEELTQLTRSRVIEMIERAKRR